MRNKVAGIVLLVLAVAGIAGVAAAQSANRGSDRFVDVPAGHWADEAVGWAVDNGITTGTSDTTFSPDDTLTRAQMVTFLHRYHLNVADPTTTTTERPQPTTVLRLEDAHGEVELLVLCTAYGRLGVQLHVPDNIRFSDVDYRFASQTEPTRLRQGADREFIKVGSIIQLVDSYPFVAELVKYDGEALFVNAYSRGRVYSGTFDTSGTQKAIESVNSACGASADV